MQKQTIAKLNRVANHIICYNWTSSSPLQKTIRLYSQTV